MIHTQFYIINPKYIMPRNGIQDKKDYVQMEC